MSAYHRKKTGFRKKIHQHSFYIVIVFVFAAVLIFLNRNTLFHSGDPEKKSGKKPASSATEPQSSEPPPEPEIAPVPDAPDNTDTGVAKTVTPNLIDEPTPVNTESLKNRSVKIDVNYLPQNPELPSGCEITALTTVLNYYGYPITKTEMSDTYLVKAPGHANFWEAFSGNPRSSKGCGCYAPPIVAAANQYLQEQNSDLVAYDFSYNTFEDLLKVVEKGTPVIIWGTEKMQPARSKGLWTVGNVTFPLIVREHCLVLIGYDLDRNVAIFSDPLVGIAEYDLAAVKSRYLSLYSQAVVVR